MKNSVRNIDPYFMKINIFSSMFETRILKTTSSIGGWNTILCTLQILHYPVRRYEKVSLNLS